MPPPPVGGDPFQMQPAPPPAPAPQPYIAPAPLAPTRPSYNYDPPARNYDAPRYEAPHREEPIQREAPIYDPPPATPPLYDERREQPREERRKKPNRKLAPEGDPWSNNLEPRENYRIPEPCPKCAPPSPRKSLCSYRVKPGDTLTDIAEERYGASGPRTIARIVAVNPGLDPDRIYAGQTLVLPKTLACAAEPPPCPCAPVHHERVRDRERESGYNNALQLIPISTQAPR